MEKINDDCIFVMDKSKPVQVDYVEPQELGFTHSPNVDEPPYECPADEPHCYCKIVKSDTQKYFIRITPSGFLLDPWNPTDDIATKYARHFGRPVMTFTEVAKSCFDTYLKYLQTRNKLYLTHAEREVTANVQTKATSRVKRS